MTFFNGIYMHVVGMCLRAIVPEVSSEAVAGCRMPEVNRRGKGGSEGIDCDITCYFVYCPIVARYAVVVRHTNSPVISILYCFDLGH